MIVGSKEFSDQIKNMLECEGYLKVSPFFEEKKFDFTYTNELDSASIVVAEEGAFFGDKNVYAYIEIKRGEDGLYAEQFILGRKLAPIKVVDVGAVLQGMIVMVNHLLKQGEKMEALETGKKALEYARERAAWRLQDFHNVQQRVYEEAEKLPGFETRMLCLPHEKVSGDFVATGVVGSKTFIVVGDVTDHGEYAAVYASVVTALIRSYFSTCPVFNADILSLFFYIAKTSYHFHGELEGSSGECVICEIDKNTRKAKFCSFGGGLIPPFIVKESGEVNRVFSEDDADKLVPRFGDHLVDDMVPFVKEIPYKPGDAILFYSDGFTEAFSNVGTAGEKDQMYEYGLDNLDKVLHNAAMLHGNSPKELVQAVVQDVGSYGTKNATEERFFEDKLNDDALIFCIRRME